MNMSTPTAGEKNTSRWPTQVATVLAAWRHAWRQRSPREQLLLGLGTWVLALSALWSVALSPAWRTWQEAPLRQTQLDAQSQQMQQLQAQAQNLKKTSPMTRAEAVAWLETKLSDLGPDARISLQGEQATLSLSAAPAEALALWLSQARERALAVPVQAQLKQSATPSASPPPSALTPGSTLWRGTLTLRLP